MGLPPPIDMQIAGSESRPNYKLRSPFRARIRRLPGVADVFIPQDLDQPALKLDIDRVRARELGLSQKEVVANVITALTSNQMIAPSLWIDPRNGNPYYLAVQYPRKADGEPDRLALDSAARPRLRQAHAPGYGQQHSAH